MDEELSRYVIEELEGLEEGVRQGSGSFGSIYQVRINGMPCIAKRLHDILSSRQVAVPGTPDRAVIMERFRRECVLLSRLRHPNIVQFLGVHYGSTSSDLTLVLEHMHLDLEQCLATYPGMPLSIKLGVLKDVSYGLLHLHTRKPPIVHRDLTASNILVTPDMRAKISDLGVSRILDVSPMQLSNVTACPGTLPYMPPESLRPEPIYDVRLDSFSFGVLALFTAIQEFPHAFYGMDVPESVQKEGKSELYKRHKAMEKLTTGHCLYKIIIQCLSDDASNRPMSVDINKAMKELCANLPKRFSSVLEMHCEIWRLHGEKEQLARTLEKQPPVVAESEDHYTHRIQALTEENKELRRKYTEAEECIKELQSAQNDLTPQQAALPEDDNDLCPLPHGAMQIKSPKKDHPYVNLPLALSPPTTMANRLDMSTPTNAPYPPTLDNSRHIDRHSPCLNEQVHVQTDFHDFPANGHFSGLSLNMSSASTGSQPGSTPAFDPNLKCHGCERQFREGEIQVYRRHSSTCEKLQQLLHQAALDNTEQFDPEEQEIDPNLTCIGCGMAFKQRQIQDFKKHCNLCSMFQKRLRSQSEGNERRGENESPTETDTRDRSNTST